MEGNKRVAFNAMATYGRTLLRMGLGLFTSRWVLEALGEVDYGLMGVVGTLIVMITFLNTVMTGSCGRFFAFSIGKNDKIDLIKWFNSALSVHVLIGIVLVAIGYPFGIWAIDHFLNIPPDRIVTAKWVFSFSLLGAFWTIASTPYTSMYVATQNIAEFTLWEITQIIVNFGFVYWLTTYTGNTWFIYSAFTIGLTILLGIGQVLRARKIFEGCKINLTYWKDKQRLKEMLSFSGWSMVGSLGYFARAQFPPVLLNLFFNPLRFAYVNASYQIGGALANYTQSMSSSLLGAFTPHITTLAGADNKIGLQKSSLRASKFGTFLTLLFAIPMWIEVNFLLKLWLGQPPLLAGIFCKIVLLQMIIDNLTTGSMSAIMASGKIKWYQITTGSLCILSIPIAWVVFHFGGPPQSVNWVIAGCLTLCSSARLYFSKKILGINFFDWFKTVFLPIIIISAVAFTLGYPIRLIMPDSFLRLCVVTLVTLCSMLSIAWFILLDYDERQPVKKVFKRILSKFRITTMISA